MNPLSDLTQDYLQDLREHHYAQGTIKGVRERLKRFILFAKEHQTNDIEELNKSLMESYCWKVSNTVKRNGKEYSLSERWHKLFVVRSWMKWLVKNKHILLDPTNHLPFKRPSVIVPRHIPSPQEMEKILNKPNVMKLLGLKDRAVMEVLYSTGIRASELVNLNVYDVDTQNGILQVRQGKGGKDRIVPLGKRACASIERYRKKIQEEYLNNKKRIKRRKTNVFDQEALFLDSRGRRLDVKRTSTKVGRYIRTVKPEAKPAGCHVLRHAFGTHMVRNGAEITRVQKILGHAKLSSTEIYTQVIVSDLKKMVDKSLPRRII